MEEIGLNKKEEIGLKKEEIGLKLIEGDKVQRQPSVKKGRYTEYEKATKRLLPWIKEKIDERGTIKIEIGDFAKELGKEFEHKSKSALYLGLKFVLFHKGIVVESGTIQDDEKNIVKVFIMRKKKSGDELPWSLKKMERSSGIDVDDIEIKKGKIIPEFHKYPDAINKCGLIPKLQKLLKEKDIVEINADDIIKDMGMGKRKPESILNGIKKVLKSEGIFVRYHSDKKQTGWNRVFIFAMEDTEKELEELRKNRGLHQT